ncbi:zinc finger domain-containing protein [Micromonospora sp. DT4]
MCSARSGQRCINAPGRLLGDDRLHPERVELAGKTIRGELALPGPLR